MKSYSLLRLRPIFQLKLLKVQQHVFFTYTNICVYISIAVNLFLNFIVPFCKYTNIHTAVCNNNNNEKSFLGMFENHRHFTPAFIFSLSIVNVVVEWIVLVKGREKEYKRKKRAKTANRFHIKYAFGVRAFVRIARCHRCIFFFRHLAYSLMLRKNSHNFKPFLESI